MNLSSSSNSIYLQSGCIPPRGHLSRRHLRNNLDSLSMKKQGKGKRPKDNIDLQDQSSTMSDLQWPPQEEDFVIMLQEEGWGLGSVQSFDPDCDICVQSSMALKTRAKDDKGKTYWVYPDVEVVDEFQRKDVLDIRPSVTVAKNIRRKDLVLALLNQEIIEALFTKIFEHVLKKQSH